MTKSNKNIFRQLMVSSFFTKIESLDNTLLRIRLQVITWSNVGSFLKQLSHPNGFCSGHQCSWTLTPANSMQVSPSSSLATARGSN